MLAVIWLVAGVALAVAELFTLDFVLIMLGVGAFGAAISAAFGTPVPVQVLVFAAVSALGLVLVRPAMKNRLHRGAQPATMGIDAFVGAEATVIEEVTLRGGQVKIGGELWSARPVDSSQVYAVGALVRVVETRGATALVRQ